MSLGNVARLGDYAFLLGHFYSSGGVSHALHFAVDEPVAEYLVNTIAPRIGVKAWVRDDKKYGSIYVLFKRRPLLGKLRSLGLLTPKPIQIGNGKWRSPRDIAAEIPLWVSEDRGYMKRFVEGYINGLKSGAYIHGEYDKEGTPSTHGGLHIRFMGLNHRTVLRFARTMVSYIRSFGVGGGFNRQRNDGREAFHYDFTLDTPNDLERFTENFLILKSSIRIKLKLRLEVRDNYLLKKVIHRCKGIDAMILGMVREEPRTSEELAENYYRRPYNMTRLELVTPSIEKLSSLGIIVREVNGKWVYDPANFLEHLIKEKKKQVRAVHEEVRDLSKKFLWECSPCEKVITTEKCPSCGLSATPVTRFNIRKIANPSSYVRDLNRLLGARSQLLEVMR